MFDYADAPEVKMLVSVLILLLQKKKKFDHFIQPIFMINSEAIAIFIEQ